MPHSEDKKIWQAKRDDARTTTYTITASSLEPSLTIFCSARELTPAEARSLAEDMAAAASWLQGDGEDEELTEPATAGVEALRLERNEIAAKLKEANDRLSELEEFQNLIAGFIPEDLDDDVAQEAIILNWLKHLRRAIASAYLHGFTDGEVQTVRLNDRFSGQKGNFSMTYVIDLMEALPKP